MTRKHLMDGIKAYYEACGFQVEDIQLNEDFNTASVEVQVKAKASVFGINMIPVNVSIDNLGMVQPVHIGVDLGCSDHQWKEMFLFTSTYHKCTKCGIERDQVDPVAMTYHGNGD